MITNPFITILARKSIQKRHAKELTITTPNGIVEKTFITIGGIDQGITIRSEDRHNPVLFFVHGGPGSVYSIFAPLLRAWEQYFTLVQWDQRGAGKTRDITTLEQLHARKGHLTTKEFTQRQQITINANPAIPHMIMDIMLPGMLTSPDHTFGDTIDIFKGMTHSYSSRP
jgi:hypothetical protein